jgi:hypothetical protein
MRVRRNGSSSQSSRPSASYWRSGLRRMRSSSTWENGESPRRCGRAAWAEAGEFRWRPDAERPAPSSPNSIPKRRLSCHRNRERRSKASDLPAIACRVPSVRATNRRKPYPLPRLALRRACVNLPRPLTYPLERLSLCERSHNWTAGRIFALGRTRSRAAGNDRLCPLPDRIDDPCHFREVGPCVLRERLRLSLGRQAA